MIRLEELCREIVSVPTKHRDTVVSGITCDSRRMQRGDLFVAVRGETIDGHRFASAAAAAGAAAVVGDRPPEEAGMSSLIEVPYLRAPSARDALALLSDRFYGSPSRVLDICGVTGTKGKTTTTWLLHALIERSGGRSALFGTVENRVAGRVIPSRNTTPGSCDLHGWLREHVDRGGTHAVLELSSHAIRQRRALGVPVRACVFTNLTPEHLDYHGTFEDYRETKVGLFDGLAPDAAAVLSREDPTSWIIARRSPAQILWYGTEATDGVEDVWVGHEGLRFRWKGQKVRSKLLGYHNLLNLLGALTAAEFLGIDRKDLAAHAADLEAPPGRLEDVSGERPFRVVVDYAHTDGALEAVLRALRDVTPGRLITVFGCGGDRDRGKRPRMGRVAEEYSDQVIITTDNPRSEDPRAILGEIRSGLETPERVEIIEDRREAIALGVRMAKRGDTVLIAGKGHETYQDFGSRVVHFDDREVAREFLGETLLGTGI